MVDNTPDTENRNVFGIFLFVHFIQISTIVFVQKVKSYRKRKVFLDFVVVLWYYIREVDERLPHKIE